MNHRIFLSLTAAVLLAYTTKAQLEIRPHIGTNKQIITRSPDGTEWQGKPGSQIGAHVVVGDRFIFQPGLQYVKSKAQLSTTGMGPTHTNTLETTALRLPMVVGYRFSDPSDEPKFNFRLSGGMAANFPISCAFVDYGREDEQVGQTSFSATAGAGLDIGVFYIDVGYDLGLTDVFDHQEFVGSATSDQIQLNVGVRLKFAKQGALSGSR